MSASAVWGPGGLEELREVTAAEVAAGDDERALRIAVMVRDGWRVDRELVDESRLRSLAGHVGGPDALQRIGALSDSLLQARQIWRELDRKGP